MLTLTRRVGNKRVRRGTAATECALVLPVLIVFTIGTVEICSMLFLKESITIAAYEGARLGIQRGGTNQTATNKVLEILDDRGISYSSPVTFGALSFDNATTMQHVTLTVTVPCAGNTAGFWGYIWGQDVTANVTLRKEFTNLPPGT